jgi:phospholipase C
MRERGKHIVIVMMENRSIHHMLGISEVTLAA